LPAVSATPNDPAAASVEVTAPPPAVALDVTFTVHTDPLVCTIEEIEEIPVSAKSIPLIVDSVVQSMSSDPVTVKLIDADVAVVAVAASVTVGAVESIVTLFEDATDRLSSASTAYALYVPSASPAAEMLVAVFAATIDTWFQAESAADVMLALFVTVTLVLTKYAVPVSVLCTVADCELRIRAVVSDTVGASESAHVAVNVTLPLTVPLTGYVAPAA